MDVTDYVMNVTLKDAFRDGFPPILELPKDLVEQWHDFYDLGERLGCEYGQSLKIDKGKIVEASPLVQGRENFVTIQYAKEATEFGDVHCHPSASIGHLKGYNAHSMEDWREFKNHLVKPVFIRFVTTGDYIYAVVYRNGQSRYDEGQINDRKDELNTWMNKRFEEIFPFEEGADGMAETDPIYQKKVLKHLSKGTRDDRVAHGHDGEDKESVRYKYKSIYQKMHIPSFGTDLMQMSIEHNTYLGRLLKFGFYQGHKKNTKYQLVRVDG
jgi:hypothetical protein